MKTSTILAVSLLLTLAGCAGSRDPNFNQNLTQTLNEMNNNPWVQQQRMRQAPVAPAPIYAPQPAARSYIPPPATAPAPVFNTNMRVQTMLTDAFWQGGMQMCRYSDGTVINNGITGCPLNR